MAAERAEMPSISCAGGNLDVPFNQVVSAGAIGAFSPTGSDGMSVKMTARD